MQVIIERNGENIRFNNVDFEEYSEKVQNNIKRYLTEILVSINERMI